VESKRHLFRPTNDLQRYFGKVVVLADAAHAFGARWHGKMVGEIADFTSFSFHAVKNLTTAEGGALTWNLPFGNDNVDVNLNYFPNVPKKEGETWNELLYRLAQLFSLHGQNKDALAKTQLGAWEYDIIGPWYKCNMTDIMAAIGLRQLDRYVGLLERRSEIIAKYDALCDELGISHLIHHTDDISSSNHLYLMRIPGISEEDRNKIIEQLALRGVTTNVHYKPLPMMTAYKNLGWDIKDFPNAFDYYHNLITLPLHTLLTDDDVEYICENLREVINEFKR